MRVVVPDLLSGALVSVFLTLTPATAPTPRPEPAEPARREDDQRVAVVTGCVRGGTLTGVVMPDGDRAVDATYRLTGPRELLRVIRKEHDNHRIEVTGRVKEVGDPGVAVSRHRKVGKGRLHIGAKQGTGRQLSRVHEMPTIDVTAFRHLSRSCRK